MEHAPVLPTSPMPHSPSQTQALVGQCKPKGKGLGWREERRQTKHTVPALNQVLYFPEVKSKGRREQRVRRKRQKEPERARSWEREGTVNHCSMKSQEASAQGKKESWRIVGSCGKRLGFRLCVSPWGKRLPPLPPH